MTTIEQKIVPHLWFDKEAKEAAEFYASVFPDSIVTNIATLHDTPSGDCDVVSFVLWGHQFMAISAGPFFKFNPSESFIVNFDPSREQNASKMIDEVWDKLADGGKVIMPLDEYPFSKQYGWIQDRFGLSWQLILTDPEGEPRPPIIPSLMFAGENCGKADEAIDFYASVFKDSQRGLTAGYPAGMEPDKEGTIMFADFMIENQWLAAMDSARNNQLAFNEAISLMVQCETQEEIDYYWEKLSAVPEAEQCGWCKDRYGVSWQVVPAAFAEMMAKGSREQIDRITQAILPMKKFNLAKLQKAYEGQ